MKTQFSCIPNPYIKGEYLIEDQNGTITLRLSEALFTDDNERDAAIQFILSKLNA